MNEYIWDHSERYIIRISVKVFCIKFIVSFVAKLTSIGICLLGYGRQISIFTSLIFLLSPTQRHHLHQSDLNLYFVFTMCSSF